MKPKSFGRKLNLNKKTVANLNDQEMVLLKGGVSGPATCTCGGFTCPCAYSEIEKCPHTSAYPPGYCDTEGICV